MALPQHTVHVVIIVVSLSKYAFPRHFSFIILPSLIPSLVSPASTDLPLIALANHSSLKKMNVWKTVAVSFLSLLLLALREKNMATLRPAKTFNRCAGKATVSLTAFAITCFPAPGLEALAASAPAPPLLARVKTPKSSEALDVR